MERNLLLILISVMTIIGAVTVGSAIKAAATTISQTFPS
jgi:Flp pilus assembly pilin Flp